MFTGLVSERGNVRAAKRRKGVLELEIQAPRTVRDLREGDSVAVNGACLTATRIARKRFTTEVIDQTLAVTTLADVGRGTTVNLELPLRLDDRIGGHLVQGHVDAVAEVVRVEDHDGTRMLWLRGDDEVLRYVAAKGSMAVDGVSLTVVAVGRSTFQLSLIPHTLQVTTLGALDVGARVNVEVDMIAKYVERLVKRE